MHHIFVEENTIDFANNTINLNAASDREVFNHLVKSLRINKGEKVLCSTIPFISNFDYLCEVTDISADNISLSILEKNKANELPVTINLYQGIVKYNKFEFVIEKAVELGASAITPVSTEYCIAKIDDSKADNKLKRYNSIAKSAAEQSRRNIIPKVDEPIKYYDLIDKISCDLQNGEKIYNLLFYENAAGILDTRENIQSIKNELKNDVKVIINAIIGPEGGFSEKEIEYAKDKKISILSLGDRILRTETAAVTALSILMYELS